MTMALKTYRATFTRKYIYQEEADIVFQVEEHASKNTINTLALDIKRETAGLVDWRRSTTNCGACAASLLLVEPLRDE
jgi:hypothetical protein